MTKQEEWESLMEQVENLYNQGKYLEGIDKGKAALEMAESLGETDLALALNNLALLYESQGQYEEAEPLYLRSLEIAEKSLGKDHPEVATTLNNLGLLYSAQGRYEKVEPLYIRSLEIKEKSLGEDHPSVAKTLNNLAGLYRTQGRYEKVGPLCLRSLEIREKSLGKDHPSVSIALTNLAIFYESQDRHEEAETLYLRSLEIDENSVDKNYPSIAKTLSNLAGLHRTQGRYEDAESRYLRSLEIKENSLGKHHPSVAKTLSNLAGLYRIQGRCEEAERLYLRDLEISELSQGQDHPEVTKTLNNLALLYESQKQYKQALDKLEASLTRQYNFLRNQLLYIGEQEHQLYLKEIKFTLKVLLSLMYGKLRTEPKVTGIAMQAILLTKALSATARATRNALMYNDRYEHLKPQLSEISQLTSQSNDLDYDNPARANILSQIQGIEMEIAKAVPQMMLPDSSTLDRQAIALKLPTDSTLVEFIRFDLYNFDNNKSWGEARYLAFILPKSQSDEIQMVDLGASADIDELITACRTAIIQDFANTAKPTIPTTPPPDLIPTQPIPIPQSIDSQAISKLHERLIAPLLPYLHSHHLIVAPDGDFCHLPFDILLPNNIVTYLTTGRDLLRTPSSKPASTSLVIADPNFDNVPHKSTPVSPIPSQRVQTAGVKNLQFDPLKDFGILGRSIARKLNAQAYYQQAATKDAIVSSKCPHILSILTHGFANPATDSEPDPMARTGLALSGANLDSNNILLANEIATLDLHSNDLTILVACETALGDIQPGEGVYGLRRAFSIAGAKTTISTLWAIPVLTSVILVERFFDNLQKMGKGAALIEAQTYLRTRTQEDLRASKSGQDALDELKRENYDLNGVECPFAHPYFWAAWICQGETGQMDYMTTKALG